MFKIIKWIRQRQVRRQLFQTIGVGYDKFFRPEHVLLKGCFSFKTEVLVLAWFWPEDKFP